MEPTTNPRDAQASAPAAKKPAATERKLGAIKLAKAIKPAPKPVDEVKRPYRVGVRGDCPFQNITLAGVTFPTYTFGNHPHLPRKLGGIVRISDQQIAKLHEVISETYVAKSPNAPIRARVGTSSWPRDEELASRLRPVATYLYIEAISEEEAAHPEEEPPAAMLTEEPAAASA
jgi:hypothetical protein